MSQPEAFRLLRGIEKKLKLKDSSMKTHRQRVMSLLVVRGLASADGWADKKKEDREKGTSKPLYKSVDALMH